LIELQKAIQFNHDKNGTFKVMVNPDKELDKYHNRITQLTLPNRFGMYREQIKNVKPKTPTNVETPKNKEIDSSSSILNNPNHKARSIFD
jgi:hypothetical protein